MNGLETSCAQRGRRLNNGAAYFKVREIIQVKFESLLLELTLNNYNCDI